ncbi:MAG: ATP-binding protein [Candidatus Bilamarchaeaceae archaeon]
METDEIKRVIVSQREEIEEIFREERIVDREYERERALEYLAHPNILAVLGIRRCGKSVFSLQLLKGKTFGYLNFDDERLMGLSAGDLDRVLQAFYELHGTDIGYVILDEPQNVKGWELFANRLRRTKRVVITGSNSKLLSGELATHLTGRYVDITLFPFSFREFLAYSGVVLKKGEVYSTKKISEVRRALENYCAVGGFPEVQRIGKRMLIKIYEDIVNKDILRRYKIRHADTFKSVLRYLLSNSSAEFTFSKLQNIFGIKDVHTVRNWFGYMSSSYILFTLERFSYKLKEQVLAPKKIYAIDVGLVGAIGFRTSQRRGAIFENCVAIELARRISYWHSEWEVYYWKDHQQREVDFVVKEGRRIRQLIQVCADMSETTTKEREIKSLIKASRELRCNNLLVITNDYEGKERIADKQISFIPMWKWLLEPDLATYVKQPVG